jgi:hypothetical protein
MSLQSTDTTNLILRQNTTTDGGFTNYGDELRRSPNVLSVGVTLYTSCANGARLLCGQTVHDAQVVGPVTSGEAGSAMLGAPLVATTSEGNMLLVGVLFSDVLRDATTGSVLDTPTSLRFADVQSARAWILAASGYLRPPSANDEG